MFREGVELSEALLFLNYSVGKGKLSADLGQRVRRYLDARGLAVDRDWFGPRYMQTDEDKKLLDLAGEVAMDAQR